MPLSAARTSELSTCRFARLSRSMTAPAKEVGSGKLLWRESTNDCTSSKALPKARVLSKTSALSGILLNAPSISTYSSRVATLCLRSRSVITRPIVSESGDSIFLRASNTGLLSILILPTMSKSCCCPISSADNTGVMSGSRFILFIMSDNSLKSLRSGNNFLDFSITAFASTSVSGIRLSTSKISLLSILRVSFLIRSVTRFANPASSISKLCNPCNTSELSTLSLLR
mmetsp:Transcript_41076/g.65116  ORF Transcript_41076/g.65116 Transcript_41076/m.65116 type:complete len:229 (-) Transcript_41076:606-1292(-)